MNTKVSVFLLRFHDLSTHTIFMKFWIHVIKGTDKDIGYLLSSSSAPFFITTRVKMEAYNFSL